MLYHQSNKPANLKGEVHSEFDTTLSTTTTLSILPQRTVLYLNRSGLNTGINALHRGGGDGTVIVRVVVSQVGPGNTCTSGTGVAADRVSS